MSDTLTGALDKRAQPKEQQPIENLLERMTPALAKSLQRPEAVEALKRHYLTAVRLNPKLYECSAESLLAALLLSAQVGLEPGPLGHVYLVPYKTECTWILGYTGMMELARRSERVGGLRAEVVWNCDEYRYWVKDGDEHFELARGPEDRREERLLTIVSWKERAAGTWLRRNVECPRSRVERAKQASPAARNKSGPWLTDEDAMWRKTGIRYVRPQLPLSPQAGYALAHDEATLTDVTVDETGAVQPVALTISDD